tara:strand:+ start:3133 stop:3870 length:738 start_codon:yes stop_codon:yes gene_type:complete
MIAALIGGMVGIFIFLSAGFLGKMIPGHIRRLISQFYFDLSARHLKRIMIQGRGGGLVLTSCKFDPELLCEKQKIGRKSFSYFEDTVNSPNPFLNFSFKQYPLFLSIDKFSFLFNPVLVSYSKRLAEMVAKGNHLKEIESADSPSGVIWGANSHLIINDEEELCDISTIESLMLASGSANLVDTLQRFIVLSQSGYSKIDFVRTTASVVVSFIMGLGIMYLADMMTKEESIIPTGVIPLWISSFF